VWGPLETRYGVDGTTGVADAASGVMAGRIWGSGRIRFDLAGRGGVLSFRGGAMVGDSVPQFLFRVGGPETVRGYPYGARVGRAAWSTQLDLSLTKNNVISPVLFADAGNTSLAGKAVTSVGGAVSFFGGLVRFNLAKGLTPRTKVRFDLLFRTAR
jgi:hypothetical protein